MPLSPTTSIILSFLVILAVILTLAVIFQNLDYIPCKYRLSNFNNLSEEKKQKSEFYNTGLHFYVLNLERSPDRKQMCENEFKKIGISPKDYTFVKSIDGKQYPSKKDMLIDNNYSGGFCIRESSTRHVGCYISHLKAIKDFYYNTDGYTTGIILEDDFIFNSPESDKKTILDHLEEYQKYFENGATNFIILSTTAPGKTVKEHFYVPGWNAVAYMINKESAKILLDLLTPGSYFLKENYPKAECLWDFALFLVVKEKLRWKHFSMFSQQNGLQSTINGTIKLSFPTMTLDAVSYKFKVNPDISTKFYIENLCKTRFSSNGTLNYAMTSGSLLSYMGINDVVWGSGFFSEDEKPQQELVDKELKYLFSVRGPRSRDILLKHGINCPEIYGDPIIIAPLIYSITNGTDLMSKYKIGLVYDNDCKEYIIDLMKMLPYKRTDVFMINVNEKTVMELINDIYLCEQIYSSSIYGLMIGIFYGKQTAYVDCGNYGGKFRALDTLESFGIKNYEIKDSIGAFVKPKKYEGIKIGTQIIKSCPFMSKELKTTYYDLWSEYIDENLLFIE